MSQDRSVFELRTYRSEPGRQKDTLQLMESAGLSNMKKHGLELISIWIPIESSDERVFMLVRHSDKQSGEKNWSEFQADEEWKKAVSKSTVNGKKPVAGIDRFFFTANDYSPAIKTGDSSKRVFELRTYIATKGNLAGLNNRFRNHTLKLFEKYGMTNIAYFSVSPGEKTTCVQLLESLSPIGKSAAEIDASAPAVDCALVYFLSHNSQEAAADSFSKFRVDPVWEKAKADSEVQGGGSLTVNNGVKSLFLKAVSFSPLQ